MRVKGMRRWLLGAMLALAVFGAVAVMSYAVLNHFYGERYFITSTQTIVIENGGQQVTMDDVQYDVGKAELVSGADDADYYQLDLIYRSYTGEGLPPAPSGWDYEEDAAAPSAGLGPGTMTQVNVPTEAYEHAQTTEEPVTISNTTTTETRPIDTLPIAASIGIAMGIVAIAGWAGYRQTWSGATSALLEHGLHDMTVRDVEIVEYIMELKEFTIPELMKMTKASKITVWRTVQKLVESGLVQQTEKTKLASNGIGGRGKPSNIYRYVGAKGEVK